MDFSDILRALDATIIVGGTDGKPIHNVVACDLMSDVLTVEKEGFVLVTSLCSDQVARTADITGACGIVLTSGRRPQPGLIDLATAQGLRLVSTKRTTFETCYLLGRLLAGEGIIE